LFTGSTTTPGQTPPGSSHQTSTSQQVAARFSSSNEESIVHFGQGNRSLSEADLGGRAT